MNYIVNKVKISFQEMFVDTKRQAFHLRYTPRLTETPESPFDDNKNGVMNTRQLGKTPLQKAGNTESPRSKKSKQGHGDEAESNHANQNSRCGASESDQ